MPRSIIRTLTTAIAIAALAAPSALARPADTPPAVVKAAAAEQHTQVRGYPQRPVIDRPSYPPDTRPATPSTTQPAATPSTPEDPGSNGITIAGIAAALLALAAIAGITHHTRSAGARITA